jgi:hypothetical protein
MEEIQKSFDDDKLQDSDVVWKVGLKNWIPLTKLIPKKQTIVIPTQIEEPPQKEMPKRESNLPLKILVLFPILILVGAIYFLYPRNEGPRLPFSQLDSKTYQKLEQALKAKAPTNELILSKDTRELWLATSKTGDYSAQLNLKSVKGAILGDREVILNSKAELSNNWARFYTFDLDKGTKIIPGYYNYIVKLIPNNSNEGFNQIIAKVLPFLIAPKLEEVFSGKILFSPDSQDIFQKKLTEYKINVQESFEKPIKEKMEKWQALQSIINKVEIMLQDEIKLLKKGPAIVSFEKKYTEFLGPMLSQIVVEAKKDTTDNSKSFENEKIFLFGKEIGESTSNLVLEIKKLKKFTDINRENFSKKISDTFGELGKTAENEISKIQNELASIKK